MPNERTDDPKILERLAAGEFISAKEILEDQDKKLELLLAKIDSGVTGEQLLSIVRDLIIMAGVTNATLIKVIDTMEDPAGAAKRETICCPECRVVSKLQDLFIPWQDPKAFRCPKCGLFFGTETAAVIDYAELTDEERSWMGKNFEEVPS